MDGDFEIAEGSIEEFLAILLRNRLDRKLRADTLSALRIAGIRLLSILRGKQHNVRSHYDLGNDLFESFLDSKLTYSCGYACSPEDDLETLQTNKLDRICRKLRLERDERLLDIGCGFGGLLIHAAKHYGVTGVGITVSREHFEEGSRRIAREGLADRIAIELKDHLVLSGEYDKIVSVGMLEHVPRSEYRSYFRNIAGALRPGGRGLVHAVGCNAYRNEHDPFIQKYVFPASNQPRLSEITAELERNRLAILDVENMIRHYYYTARHWLERFRASRHLLPSSRYDGRFMRMWEYYLACCVAAAQASDSALYQVLFTNDYAAPISLQRV
jgi:cyclopropane-fatty-acyl-phospholipid synthase